MIKYALICDAAHDFESWFATSASFDEQARRGFVSCPVCNSIRVERAIMAPNVARSDRGARLVNREAAPAEPVATAPETAPVALMGEKEIAFREMVAALHAHVTANAEHVGKRFADEALKIHHGESDSRPIYGEASRDDARMLHEEGVDFLPLPRLPGTGN
ncbi:hypothetical protein IP69_12760 [Bosea sp. AAP35]|uniref:DUF1178 family protein n=1 Tax=Bosea sp. AAP35 TaxID=1523417 RepID=UPI0006B8C24A|nr:DUF1178 family protein [Bosea sp. AAP35]KPF67580.1 hypothetical protein IP69_12760 [Bosea sp. AAP35]